MCSPMEFPTGQKGALGCDLLVGVEVSYNFSRTVGLVAKSREL